MNLIAYCTGICSKTQGVTILTSDPVNSDAFHPADASSNDVLPPRLITFGPGYSVQAHVCPVHGVISCKTYNIVNDERKLDDECGCHKSIYALKQSSSWNHVLLQHGPFHQMCETIKHDGENTHTFHPQLFVDIQCLNRKGNCRPNFTGQYIASCKTWCC